MPRTTTDTDVPLRGTRRGALVALRSVSLVFAAVAVLIMVPLIGVGVFESDAGESTGFGLHGLIGLVLWGSTLLMAVLGVVARAGWLLIARPVVLFALMALQSPLLLLARDTPALGWLHPLNGLVIAGLAAHLGVLAKARLRAA